MDNYPLVSVPVITYNSSAYIIDGLESIKAQTYPNVELVVSDDCSTDDTIEVVKRWIDENSSRFVRTQLVTTTNNTGIAGNCNRAIKVCNGEWIKGLSGDDKFLPNTIEGYVRYVIKHPEVDICFAKLSFWGEDEEYVRSIEKVYENSFYPNIKNEDVYFQYREMLKQIYVPGPGLFYKRKIWEEVGGFDEKYPFCDEWPFTVRVLEKKHRIYFIDEELYGYHVRQESVSHSNSKVNRILQENIISYFLDERRSKLIEHGMRMEAFDLSLIYRCQSARLNSKKVEYYIYKYLRLFSPVMYLNKINAIKRIFLRQ